MAKEELSPMMQLYMETKKQYPDCILMYRIGDFFEMFFDDAKTASNSEKRGSSIISHWKLACLRHQGQKKKPRKCGATVTKVMGMDSGITRNSFSLVL